MSHHNNALDKVTRFEVIDHTKDDSGGRILVRGNVHVQLSYQDDDRTLKVFLTSREETK